VLLIAASFLLAMGLVLAGGQPVGTRDWAVLAIGIGMIPLAFLIRSGRAGLIPLAMAITLPVLVFRIALAPTLLSIVPIFALLLCISGLRGWLWLRTNKGR
jgi:hypothetical protein